MLLQLKYSIPSLQFVRYCTKAVSKNKLYSSTVLLPKTTFPLKLEGKKLLERDDEINNNANFQNLYSWQRSHLCEPEFVLHDGPPYANGTPHMGHAINKILKDAILRYKIINGNKVHYIPGWDCHGLPIELKALSNSDNLSPLKIRAKARNFATKSIEEQKKVFESWGVMGDWKNPYTTYSVDYVKNQFQRFYKLYKKNLVYRDVKPIYWSPSSRTALAEAELEYNEKHESTSIYVRLRMKDIPGLDSLESKRVYALIWTTTPWSLPANQAVCYNEKLSYSLVKKDDTEDKDIYIVATELLDDLSKSINCNLQLLGVFAGDALHRSTYVHPIYKEQIGAFLNSSHVMANKGTGLVHSAPAHGPEDFLVALNNKLPIVNLVNELGCYTSEAGTDLSGKFVLNEGTAAVLELIKDDLMHVGQFIHSYPYDWRTKQPVIIRANKQWFVDTNAIKSRAVEILENVTIIPKTSSDNYKNNLINQLKKRPYWCISRQRKWGVPIPVFYEKNTSKIILNEDLINHFCNLLDLHGTDFWWKLSDEELFPSDLREELNLADVERGQDILDIWFDSGISWSKVLNDRKVADMYLEGVDQFTGWFQSSLMTSVALRDKAPYKTIYVHGFAVDKNGIKMSKSLGNIVDPADITRGTKEQKPFGIDALRWWVACHANQDPIAYVSNNVLQSSADEVQKIRGVLRFALGSLNNYKKSDKDFEHLLLIDKYILHLLYAFYKQANEAVNDYQFQKMSISLTNLLTNSVSALYYSAIKDRLYCDKPDSSRRRAAQFVMLEIFEIVTQLIAPIVPHLVEEMYVHLPQKDCESYFTSKHSAPSEEWHNEQVEKAMDIILNVKRDVNRQLGASTSDAVVVISLSSNKYKYLKGLIPISDLEDQIVDILQISKAIIQEDASLSEDYKLDIKKSVDFSCPRCRRVCSEKKDEPCNRCTEIVIVNNKTAVSN